MKLTIDSDGTMKGTSVEFKMTADEIPKMINRAKRSYGPKVPKKRQPQDIVVPDVVTSHPE